MEDLFHPEGSPRSSARPVAGSTRAGLAPYIGLGTFNVTISADMETYLSTTSGFGPLDPVPGRTDGTVTVTYEFTPVPEPGTALLLGGGLLAALGAARRRAG